MNEPQGAQQMAEVAGHDGTTLTDEEIETRRLDTAPRASVDDESDPVDPGDDADDSADDAGDDTGDDSGDVADPSDTGDDTGDDSGDDA